MLWWVLTALAVCPRVDAEVVRFGEPDLDNALVVLGGPFHLSGLGPPITLDLLHRQGQSVRLTGSQTSNNVFDLGFQWQGLFTVDGNPTFAVRPDITWLTDPSFGFTANLRRERGAVWLDLSAEDHARLLVTYDNVALELLVLDEPLSIRLVDAIDLVGPDCICDPCLAVDGFDEVVMVHRLHDPSDILSRTFPEETAATLEIRVPGCSHRHGAELWPWWLTLGLLHRRRRGQGYGSGDPVDVR